jgi:hypothetical protein
MCPIEQNFLVDRCVRSQNSILSKFDFIIFVHMYEVWNTEMAQVTILSHRNEESDDIFFFFQM